MTYPKPGKVAVRTEDGKIDVQEHDHVQARNGWAEIHPTVRSLKEVQNGTGNRRAQVVQFIPSHRVHNITIDYREDSNA